MKARQRVEYTKKLLDEIGVGGERLEMYNLSASMGPKFVEVANEMVERARKLGQNPLFKGNGK